jgi:hypothetical protein
MFLFLYYMYCILLVLNSCLLESNQLEQCSKLLTTNIIYVIHRYIETYLSITQKVRTYKKREGNVNKYFLKKMF